MRHGAAWSGGAVEAAAGGDAKARDWLSSYLVGKPENGAAKPSKVIADELAGVDIVINALNDRLSLLNFSFDDDSHKKAAAIRAALEQMAET